MVLVIIAAALWATVGVATRLVPEARPLAPELFGFARMALAGPAVLLFAMLARRGPVAPRGRLRLDGILVFALSSAVFQICLFRSFAAIGVTVTVFLTVCLPPLLALAWSLMSGHARVTWGALLALATAASGLALFSFGDGAMQTEVAGLGGMAAPIVASAAFVVMSYAARSLSRSAPPLLVAGSGLLLSSLLLLPAALSLIWAMPTGSQGGIGSPSVLLLLLYLGLGPTALAYICYCTGMARCSSTVVGLIASMIEPMIAALLAMTLLKENLSPTEASGCLLLILAMWVLWRSERGGGTVESPPARTARS